MLPPPAATYGATLAPSPVIEYVAPAPVIEYIAPAPAVTYVAPGQQLPPPYTMSTVTTGVNLDITGLVNPPFSITTVEVSAPQVVGSLPPSEEFAAPVYGQVHQEQIIAENVVENPAVQEQVIAQEIPQVPIVDWIPEQIVETTGVPPQERVELHTAKQIVHVPVPQIQEQSAVTGLVNSQIPITAVEASQVSDSFSLSKEFATPTEVTTLNTSSTSTSSSAPVYNRVRQKPFDAEEIPLFKSR